MLQAITLGKPLKDYYEGHEYGVLLNLKQINTFIGTNNSGKSRLLRHLFSYSNTISFWMPPQKNQLRTVIKLVNTFRSTIDQLKRFQIHYHFQPVIDKFVHDLEHVPENYAKSLVGIYHHIFTIAESEFNNVTDSAKRNTLKQHLRPLTNQLDHFKQILHEQGIPGTGVRKIYIPILRGLRPFSSAGMKADLGDIYKIRTFDDYFQNSAMPGAMIFTGLTIYEDVKKLLLGDESDRIEIGAFENFLSQYVFKEKINLIPKYDDDVLHIKIGDSEQFPIYHLGDGLQTLIIILFPIFINRNEEYLIFIEEPETHLHPKWQRLLITALGSFERHYFFISTHSSVFINHPSSSTFIVSKRDNKTHIQHSDVKSEKAQLLRELGYKPNDLFQTNYILWVEGQSDKIYLNYLIQKLDPSLQEEEDYSIMFYGGSSYKHFLLNNGDFNLEFVQALNQNYGIVLDSDRKKSGEKYNLKKKAIQQLFKKNGAFCWLTRLREIENYIPSAVFERAVKTVHKLKDIGIDQSDFGDRCKVEDLNAKPSFKSTIKLSSTVFSRVQKNKDGSTKGISAADLRKEVEASIQATKKTFQNIDKVRVADEVARIGFDLENDELKKKMTKLVNEIKKANEG